jgi:hypothetical protein
MEKRMSTTAVYTLSDRTIAQLLQLLQLGILTGTDVSDHFRTLRVVPSENGKLEPDPDFEQQFEENLVKMKEQAQATESEPDPDAN